MTRRNQDVREAAKKAGVYLWQIAEEMGIADNTFTRRLRKELSPGEKDRIFAIIKRLSN